MIIYLCLKHESNTPMYLTIFRTYGTGRTGKGDAICPPPHYKWRGHKKTSDYHPEIPQPQATKDQSTAQKKNAEHR